MKYCMYRVQLPQYELRIPEGTIFEVQDLELLFNSNLSVLDSQICAQRSNMAVRVPISFAIEQHDQQSSPLRTLPSEILVNILQRLLKHHRPIGDFGPYAQSVSEGDEYRLNLGLTPSILQTCQKLYREGVYVLYTQNTLLINTDRAIYFNTCVTILGASIELPGPEVYLNLMKATNWNIGLFEYAYTDYHYPHHVLTNGSSTWVPRPSPYDTATTAPTISDLREQRAERFSTSYATAQRFTHFQIEPNSDSRCEDLRVFFRMMRNFLAGKDVRIIVHSTSRAHIADLHVSEALRCSSCHFVCHPLTNTGGINNIPDGAAYYHPDQASKVLSQYAAVIVGRTSFDDIFATYFDVVDPMLRRLETNIGYGTIYDSKARLETLAYGHDAFIFYKALEDVLEHAQVSNEDWIKHERARIESEYEEIAESISTMIARIVPPWLSESRRDVTFEMVNGRKIPRCSNARQSCRNAS